MSQKRDHQHGENGVSVAANVIRNGVVCKCCLVPFKDEATGHPRVCDLCWEAAREVDGELDTGGEEE